MKKINIILSIILIIAIVGMFKLFSYMHKKNMAVVSYPYFASTKYTKSNVRTGPSKEFPVSWTYTRKNTPIKIITEYQGWLQIQDFSGKIGWIYRNNISNTKSGFTLKKITVYKQPNINSDKVATIDKNIILLIKKQQGDFYNIEYTTKLDLTNLQIEGWVQKELLWGGEIVTSD